MAITKKYSEIIRAAKIGGAITKKYFGTSLKLEKKSVPADLRTIADLESEEAILKIIFKAFPDYNIVSEETGEVKKGSEYTFYIDPLDGTNNFTLGIPYFCTAIGLMKGDETIFGAIYNPILDNLYCAEKNKGAYLNQKKITVNNEKDIKNSSVSVVCSFETTYKHEAQIVSSLYAEKQVKRVLRNWSLCMDLCLLASGRIEAIRASYIPLLHDFIAGKLIAKEAGALITNFDGTPDKNDKNEKFLITNGTKIHKEILEILS